jgi:hypothetical protein
MLNVVLQVVLRKDFIVKVADVYTFVSPCVCTEEVKTETLSVIGDEFEFTTDLEDTVTFSEMEPDITEMFKEVPFIDFIGKLIGEGKTSL